MEGRQLTLELFERLDEAVRIPEEMSVSDLLQQLDVTLDGVPVSEQMTVAGEALTKIVAAFSERAELLLLDWEDRCRGPLVDGNWLEGLVGRAPTFELAAYETEPVRLPSPPRRTRKDNHRRVRYVSKDEALAALETTELETVEEIVALAQKEEIVAIEKAIWNKLKLGQRTMGLGELSRLIDIGMLPVLLSVLLSDRLKLDIRNDSFYVRFDQIFVSYV
ncbi:MAG: hypothetical protein AAGE92_01600 [Cyanobacteria bacterium P01_G01_bin.4]